ncbi:MAG: isopeptide-forming domain-containing fimbrial protein, partial [Eubacteriaceae bacterium]|nr:isopeptide-forming domain-containing fimbrial protein [Eubacteriaceae bacterium]
ILNDVPMRMRFFEIGEDYAVIGMLLSRARVVSDNQDQAAFGVFKIPIQKENLFLSIEKTDESGATLAGADMELHKDAVSDTPYSTWNTSKENPKDFENIEAGKYIIVEENAPEGYTKVEPIEFALNDDGTVQITKDPSGKATVEMVDGVATIKVADPKEPDPTGTKTETDPGDGKPVKVGQEITYEITTKNEYLRNADIVITDPLDQGLDFVTADNDGKYDENTRTVTWSFKGVEPGKTVKVTFKAKVNEKAVIKVINKAKITYDNKPAIETPQVENPIPEPPVKTEPKPGENEPVAVGDEVTYEVTQKNYKDAPADIVFTDHLDKRVDFVSADNDGSYDANTHTITWTIKNVPSGETAKVGFVVKVNDKATEIIENQAIAKVGDDPEQETNIIKNPLKTPVVKTEITPGEGKQVKVGDEVTYKVHFRNYRFTPETVVVTDRLDPGVDFVSADNNGTYDKANHMIVWTFKDMEARKEQDVTFKVKVNSKAGTVIRNQAEVKVGNDPAQKTNIIENPLAPGTAKTGVDGNNNTLIFVIIGILCVAALGCGIYFFNKKQKENTVTEGKTAKKDTNAKDKKDVK